MPPRSPERLVPPRHPVFRHGQAACHPRSQPRGRTARPHRLHQPYCCRTHPSARHTSPRRKPPGQERSTGDKVANHAINALRAAVERAIAHLKDWKIFATRYRGPLTRFPLVAKTVTALAFYKKGW
ncbi:hypothetical protein OG215_39400 (plasmid) [Streptomyces globisporus]|uniref:transposase family protein n=1 Tax=Streptomyces globisporus TaxID=1908 RepID=UPI003868FEB2|nr:hypothetical protein OG215_39400 [Streptomyces globisporus]